VRVLNRDIVRALRISEDAIESVAEAEREELARRETVYRGERAPLEIEDRTIILVDDGLATGATMKAAVEAVRERQPKEVIVAVPTASPDVASAFERIADKVVCAATPTPFHAVGASYDRFDQTIDQEVQDYMARARHLGLVEDSHESG
jgi:putative phosphoribosyl transferase